MFADEPPLPERWEKLIDQVGRAAVHRIGNSAYPRHPIGRFEGIGLRGIGGFGIVFEVYDPKLDRNVALKLVQSPNPSAGPRVLEEARALAKISHPNVITVLETGECGEDLFFTMAYVEGGLTAEDFCLRKPHPSWQAIVDVYLAAGAGLAAAHAAGVVHGDFKPVNILLDPEAKWPRVADFGLAQIRLADAPTDAREDTCRRGGTVPYMAPELLRGQAADARSDQWAFCVALWQSVEGVLPFVGVNSRDMLDAIEHEPPRFTGEHAPESLREVLRLGLSIDPRDRHVDMDALLQALARVREAEDVAVIETPSPAPTPPPPPPRKPGWRMVAAGMLAAGITFVAMRGGRERPVLEATAGVGECAIAAGESISPQLREAVLGVCRTIRAGEFERAAGEWDEHYRHGDIAIADATLIIARTYVEVAEWVQYSDSDAARRAVENAEEWARMLDDEHPGRGAVEARIERVRSD